MLNTIVMNYKIVADIQPVNHEFNGNSVAVKEIVKYVFPDNSTPRALLDIGFGIGELARIVKTSDATTHWQVDGIDGFDETCKNLELFNKSWYRNIWHGLAQEIPPEKLAEYDLLCLFDVIEHLNPVQAKDLLKSLLESMGPHSRLVLSTPLWFYPQDHNRDGDLEEHLIGVPARSMLAMQPLMYLISSDFLIGNFVFSKDSLQHIDEFQPTTDRSFGRREGFQHLAELGAKADNVLYYTKKSVPEEMNRSLVAAVEPMGQTPAHMEVNHDLLSLIPATSRRIVEVGCMHGALAQAFKAQHPHAFYTGIDIDPGYAQAARAHCNEAIAANIEMMADAEFTQLFPSDCWIFGDCLEHLRDPWRVLQRVRSLIDRDGCLLACIPNAQHWSVQWRLASGNFRYEDNGLMDRTHIRWFTRLTMLEMFKAAGWDLVSGVARNLESPHQVRALNAVRSFALGMGLDPDVAVQDATPFQYVFKLRPSAG